MNYSEAIVPPLLLSMLMLTACGRFGVQPQTSGEPTTGPAIALHEPTLTPGCFSEAGRSGGSSLPELTETEAQLLSAERQMREFRMSYILQEATLILREVLRDPTATHWARQRVDERGELFVEGFSTARGEGWGRRHFILSFVPADDSEGQHSVDINAEIRYSPQSTRYDFGGHAFEVHDDYIVIDFEDGPFIRGCDPSTGTSFERLPLHSRAATFIDRTMCWSEDDPVPVFETEREANEFAASRRLQCLQRIAHVTL